MLCFVCLTSLVNGHDCKEKVMMYIKIMNGKNYVE